MIRFLFRAILALLMIGIVFSLVGLYLWEVTGEDDYTPPADVENDNSTEQQEQSLENEGYFDFAPQWSPDGQFIVFTSNRSQNNDVWVVSSTASSLRNLTADSLSADIYPMWSPDGQWIVFMSEQSGNVDIWMMGADGTNPVNLTSASIEPDTVPQWSPDGQFIAYLSGDSERSQIRLINMESREISTVTETSTHSYIAFDWSPNLMQIAVVETMIAENDVESNNSGLTQISILSIDGVLLQSYRPTQPVSDIKWSPDGSKFLLTVTGSVDSTAPDFIIMSFDGSEQEIIIPEDFGFWVSDWSPNGTSIAFSTISTQIDGTSASIWIVDADGSNLRNLTESSSINAAFPDWSPDGMRIAFTGRQSDRGNSDIWVMNADGSNLINLTGGE